MALNKLKKWIGTQAMTAFFDQLNDNVDATNAVIDLVEQNAANIASHLISIARDVSLTGIQTISTPIKPKKITIYSVVDDSKRWGIGLWANNTQRGIYQNAGNGLMGISSACVIVAEASTNINRGTIQNVTETGFEINWARTGTLSGTAYLYIVIN